MEYIKREGTQTERPLDVDTTSSSTTVYIRRNQEQVEETTDDGDTIKKWIYEEAEIEKSEYDRQQNDLSSPLAKTIMQANTELIAKNELLQIQIEILMDVLTQTAAAEEGE